MDVLDVLHKSLSWARKRDYAGYDPFDALSSPLLCKSVFDKRPLRILFTQLLKRSPVDLRNILGVKPSRNPKGIALFASTYDNLYRKFGDEKYIRERDQLIDWLRNNCNIQEDTVCWGYNFPWQSRRSFLLQGEGCSVVTFFVGESPLLEEQKKILRGIAEFYLKELNVLLEDDEHLCLSYTPYEKEEMVVNANALIGYQLSRIGKRLGNDEYIEKGRKLINWVVSEQKQNGGWIYSPTSHLGMDNFHNGYVIWALMKYYEINGEAEVKDTISKGLRFYETLFNEGRPLYSTQKEYPVDIHNCAQGIITFKEAEGMDFYQGNMHEKILRWTLDNMWDGEKNYFYYQKNTFWTNKVPYMRWSQAWMCYAMSLYLTEGGSK